MTKVLCVTALAAVLLFGGGAALAKDYPPPTVPPDTTLPPDTTVPPCEGPGCLPPQCDPDGQPPGCVPPPDCGPDGGDCVPPPCYDPYDPGCFPEPCPPGQDPDGDGVCLIPPVCVQVVDDRVVDCDDVPAEPERVGPVAAQPGVTG